jgi:hypothetical protein
LAVPLLVRHGLIEAFVKVYGSLHPSFYGLRTVVVALFLAALLRLGWHAQSGAMGVFFSKDAHSSSLRCDG